VFIDKDGRLLGWIFAGIAARCALPYVFAAHRKFDSDKMKHCWVSCMIARDCGQLTSHLAGLFKELRDLLFGGGLEDSMQDFAANQDGYDCAGAGSWICLGNVTRWFQQSCEDCCREKGY